MTALWGSCYSSGSYSRPVTTAATSTTFTFLTALLLMFSQLTAAYNLDPDSEDSVKNVARQMTEDLMSFYNGDKPGNTPGLLPQPYYWWEAGAMMGAMVDYWYYTGDSTWNSVVEQALLFQVGKNNDYMPINQTRTEGNDDQGFWGLAVMSAAEHKFPNPPPDKPQWLALAQAVFNTQAARWDTEHCKGGLRWQIFQWNNGYDYKNSISQACFFALGARLALYTGNTSYSDWAETTWQWMVDIKFIDDSYYVYDGASIGTSCTDIVPYQFSYNAGGMILGAAAMYNFTGSQVWKNRLDGLLKAAEVFFVGEKSDIMQEVACEPVNLCNLDQQSFKAYLSRWLASMTKWAPYTYSIISPKLRASSIAAAAQCKGGSNGRMCGLKWTENGVWDGMTGVGQQMAAMQIVLTNLIKNSSVPVTADTGGTSIGNPAAGSDDIGRINPQGIEYRPLGAGDRAGAAILTIAVLAGLVMGIVWMMMDETSDETLSERWGGFRSTIAGGGAATAALVKRRNRQGLSPMNEKGKGVADTDSSTGGSLRVNSASGGSDRMPGLPMHTRDIKSRSSMMERAHMPAHLQRASMVSMPEQMSGARGMPREHRLRKSQGSIETGTRRLSQYA